MASVFPIRMARQANLVKINPAVVKWIIDDSGLDTVDLAERLRVEKSDIKKRCTGRAEIEIKNLEKLSKAVRRPVTVFFLPNPPGIRNRRLWKTAWPGSDQSRARHAHADSRRTLPAGNCRCTDEVLGNRDGAM